MKFETGLADGSMAGWSSMKVACVLSVLLLSETFTGGTFAIGVPHSGIVELTLRQTSVAPGCWILWRSVVTVGAVQVR